MYVLKVLFAITSTLTNVSSFIIFYYNMGKKVIPKRCSSESAEKREDHLEISILGVDEFIVVQIVWLMAIYFPVSSEEFQGHLPTHLSLASDVTHWDHFC